MPANAITSASADSHRVIRYVASDSFLPLLNNLGASLLVSTYLVGKVVLIGAYKNQLVCEFHNFELAMGMALHAQRLAVGTGHDVWFLEAAPEVAPTIEPNGKYDGCFVTRRATHTGAIDIHEMGYVGDELWVVNTLFSCLATLDDRYHFVPRWKPSFVSDVMGPEDRCHLNGMAIDEAGAAIRYVTCLGETDEPEGWRANKSHGGAIVDVAPNAVLASGLCMPHSPRLHGGNLWVLDSGRGELQTVDRTTGARTTVDRFPGYPRGMSFHGPFAFIALSRIRETSAFDGVPLAENRENLKCGLAVVDLREGKTVASFQFMEGVEELFDVKVVPGLRCVALRGPNVRLDEVSPIWIVPPLL